MHLDQHDVLDGIAVDADERQRLYRAAQKWSERRASRSAQRIA
ncbi:MAG TPA: hypothetical protein VGF39_00755 [Stellaceae bacterium]|jgi:hypothetical protein